MRRVVFVALALVVAAACTSFSGNDAAAPADAGADATPPPPQPFDASNDASNGADAGPYCARRTGLLFCDDFDDGPLGARWDNPYVFGGGSIRLDPSGSSPPYALLSEYGAIEAGVAQAALYKGFSTVHPRHLHCGVDVRIDAFDDAGAPIDVVHVGVEAPPIYESWSVAVRPSGPILFDDTNADGGPPAGNTFPIAATFPTGEWTRVELDVQVTPDAGVAPSITVELDGVVVLATSFNPVAAGGRAVVGGGSWTVQVPTNGWSARFDNLAFSAE